MMMRFVRTTWAAFLFGFVVFAPRPLLAEPQTTIAIFPDPSCQKNPLVPVLEQALVSELGHLGLQVQNDPPKPTAALMLRYFLSLRRDGESIWVQVDGHVVSHPSNKFLAEVTAISDPYPSDDTSKQEAASQAGKRLAESLVAELSKAQASEEVGRKIMLQVTLAESNASEKEAMAKAIARALNKALPKPKGSTDKSFSFLLTTTLGPDELAKKIEGALPVKDASKLIWVMKSKNSMILQIERR